MAKPLAIKVEGIGKQYRLGEVGTGTVTHDLNRWWHKVRGKEDPYLKIGEANDRSKKGNSDLVWALQDISFEVEQGEVLGIIGKNGAGKSTLLKILSRVTSPTTGSIKTKGRLASLLEVGTGFHPELSGRENIFLNGAILGMTKKEITSKFDEIVDFSGVERYIDTPVKRYSSGMYVRLAFGVAAHLEPEILVVDEVLAVGDAEFQKKCIGKMKSVSGEGRTVLFVSHNIDAVNTLCTKAIYLKNGLMKFSGDTRSAISEYLNSDSGKQNIEDYKLSGTLRNAVIKAVNLHTDQEFIDFRKNVTMDIEIFSKEEIANAQINVGFNNAMESGVAMYYGVKAVHLEANRIHKFRLEINTANILAPGDYRMAVSLAKGDVLGVYENLDIVYGFPNFRINVDQRDLAGVSPNLHKWRSDWPAICLNGDIKLI
jgi:lipopolysaccharide transport system ATP-binding protein